jgi:hypothetical protein
MNKKQIRALERAADASFILLFAVVTFLGIAFCFAATLSMQ